MKAVRGQIAIIAAATALTAAPALAHEGHSHGTPLGLIGVMIAIGGAIIYWAWRRNA